MRFLLFPLLFAIVAILLAILLAVPPWAEEAHAIAEEDYVASQPQRAVIAARAPACFQFGT